MKTKQLLHPFSLKRPRRFRLKSILSILGIVAAFAAVFTPLRASAQVTNGGFEDEANFRSNWNPSGSGVFLGDDSARAKSDSGFVYFGADKFGAGLNGAGGSIEQSVTVPAFTESGPVRPALTFQLWVASDEGAGAAFDTFTVKAGRDVLAVYSNRDKTGPFSSQDPRYTKKTVSLAAYGGQAITIKFSGPTDSDFPTIFRLDDVAISLLPKVTVTPAAGANGTISPSEPQVVPVGASLSFTAMPDSGFAVNQWKKSGATVQNDGGSYTVKNVTASETVQVTFKPSDLDTAFGPGANGEIQCIAMQKDGKILVGGDFTNMGGFARLARLHANGSIDDTFVSNPSSSVYSIAVQADGKILIGGHFTNVGGMPRNRIARLNADGSLDDGFDPNANSDVTSIAVQPDGNILIGGWFTTVGNPTVTRNHLARLHPDGILDTAFNPGPSTASNHIDSIAVQPDGKILIGGVFGTVAGGAQRRNVARLNANGGLDTFNPDANGSVSSIAVQPDRKILIGGSFRNLGSSARSNLVRVFADGNLDAVFKPGVNGDVYSIAMQTDGRILIGGRFTSVGGVTRTRLARLNADGTLDAGFDPNPNDAIDSIALQADGNVLIGGQFTSMGGVTRNHIARLSNEPAPQSLTVSSAGEVLWQRAGASPETQRVTFQVLSSDPESKWMPLGAATRIADGWHKSGLNLPPSGTIHARLATSDGAGSTGLVQAVASFPRALVTVTPVPGSHGSLSPGVPWKMARGGSVTFCAIPASGYQVASWSVNGTPVQTGGDTCTAANVQANATVSVSFKAFAQ